MGDAKRLVDRHGHELRYCYSWKQWLIWDGKRWVTDDKGSIYGLAKGTTGIVITDGYEGDYATWKESLAAGVPVATLQDVDWTAKDPAGALKILAERAGIQEQAPSRELPERSFTLCGWTLRLLDRSRLTDS